MRESYRLYGILLSIPIEMSFGLMTVTEYLTSCSCSMMDLNNSSRIGSVKVFESGSRAEGARQRTLRISLWWWRVDSPKNPRLLSWSEYEVLQYAIP